jgi:serine/threonine protein phosphatase 1
MAKSATMAISVLVDRNGVQENGAMSLTFAIGDIHGCIGPMKRLLARIEAFASGGSVVFLGDYIDRGPDSKAVLDTLMGEPPTGWRWVALKGNHEDMMVGAREGRYEEGWWLDNGGLETLASYGRDIPVSHLEWAASLPLLHQDEHRIYVHAGVRDGIYFEDQTPDDLMWTRFPPCVSGEYWGKHLVHGHTPSPENPQTIGNRTNLDSACVFGGSLSCAVFDDGIGGGPIEFMQVRA